MDYSNQYYSPQKMPQSQQQQHQHQSQAITVHNTQPGQNRRGPWSPEEDRKLMELISIFGPSNWVRISNTLNTRTPKQCRERYHQNLKPSLNRTPITNEEGELIEKLVAKYGKKWAEIARHLNGRSDNAIKNWWNGGANRRRRASTQVGIMDEGSSGSTSGSGKVSPDPAVASAGAGSVSSILHDHKPLPSVPTSSTASSLNSVSVLPTPSSLSQPQSSQSSQHSINSVSSQTSFSLPPPLPQKQHSTVSTSSASSSTTIPSQYPQVPHLPQISFNTSMFGGSQGDLSKEKLESMTPPHPPSGSMRPSNLRSASFDIHSNNLPHLQNILPSIMNPQQSAHGQHTPSHQSQQQHTDHPPVMLPSKRRLIDESQMSTARRHSTANTIYSLPHSTNHYTNSNPNLTQCVPLSSTNSGSNSNSTGNVSPYYGSPLLLGHQASRHNSLSHFEFSSLASGNNSSSTSRRSSIAPDFFPNPLSNNNSTNNNNTVNGSNNSIATPNSHKRNTSQNSFNSPSISTTNRFSVSGPSSMSKLTPISNGNQSKPLPPIQDQSMSPTGVRLPGISTFSDNSEKKIEEDKAKVTKISVSNLID
ncbi:hypothetical protein CLIB1423_18S01486 [[Candida] railenensis]|uniref:Uncharacterized protein n=1 Tax=[Candida] railenensis TaxID=45579 RepID=A0A9P0QTL4_9ASCO|nr:hypothetical protein CLIB1423_18S01486 [[Candida] railenensis]